MTSSPLRILRGLLLVIVVAVAVTAGVGLTWTAIGGGPLPLNGWIALSLGVGGTVALTWILMALAFRSDREGWDDRADGAPDPDVENRKDP